MIIIFASMYRATIKSQRDTYFYMNSRAQEYWNFVKDNQRAFSFIMILMSSLNSLRFFFTLKATRQFGPFTKLIKLNALALSQWLIFMLFILLIGSNFFSILLQENQACHGLYSCVKGLVEATAGKTVFKKNDGNWSANISLMAIAYILAAVLMNMVIAKMNSTYLEVQRKGTLQYYKDLFDLRYVYKLDSEYGYLVALEHPFSLMLLPTLCIVKRLERRKKKIENQEAMVFLGLERKRNREVKETWKCCLCFTCKKVSKYEQMQLADFNYAMLRTIYAFYLSLFSLMVLAVGLALIPFGYLAIVVLRVKIIYRKICTRKKESFQLTDLSRNSLPVRTIVCYLLFFIIMGPVQLLYRSFVDTLDFITVCWKDNPQKQNQFKSAMREKDKLVLTKEELMEISDKAKQIVKTKEEKVEDCYQEYPIELLKHSLIPQPRNTMVHDRVFFNTFMLSIVHPRLVPTELKDSSSQQQLNIQEQCRKIIAEFQLRKKCERLNRLGPLLMKMTMERRRTFPLEIPLKQASIILRGYLSSIETYERIKRIQEWECPVIEGGFPRLRKQADIKISSIDNGVIQVKSIQQPQNQEKENNCQFWFKKFMELYGDQKKNYDGRKAVYLSFQKIIDATEAVKIIELEREEALKKIEASLDY